MIEEFFLLLVITQESMQSNTYKKGGKYAYNTCSYCKSEYVFLFLKYFIFTNIIAMQTKQIK